MKYVEITNTLTEGLVEVVFSDIPIIEIVEGRITVEINYRAPEVDVTGTVLENLTQASTRENLTALDTILAAFGKVMKWFSDLGTAAFKNVPASGNASSTEVVLGSDTRLSDSRTASDVESWAKASTKPSYTYSEVGARAASYKGWYDSEKVASPTSGTLTLKEATETFLETALTNSNVFTVALPTAVVGQVNESILIFKIGATLPTITQPTGTVYRGATPTLAINTTWTFVYEQVNTTGSTFEIYCTAIKNA